MLSEPPPYPYDRIGATWLNRLRKNSFFCKGTTFKGCGMRRTEPSTDEGF
jgi:hypothetical protein